MKDTFRQLFTGLLRDESGQDMIEYVLVAALIALGSIAAMQNLSSSISDAFTNIGSSVVANV